MRDLVAREVRRLQQAHREGSGPAVDRATIISLIRKVDPAPKWSQHHCVQARCALVASAAQTREHVLTRCRCCGEERGWTSQHMRGLRLEVLCTEVPNRICKHKQADERCLLAPRLRGSSAQPGGRRRPPLMATPPAASPPSTPPSCSRC